MSSDASITVSPVHQFITDYIVPRRDHMNVWKDVKKHQDILLEDAQKRRRTTATKLGSGFQLKRDGQRIGGLDAGVTTLVSSQALQATQSLRICHDYLRASGVPTTEGKSFHVSNRVGADEYRQEHSGGRVIVRPGAYLGKPVVSHEVSSSEEFHQEWTRSSEAVAHLKSARQQVQVEAFSPALSVRVFVVAEVAVAAIVRVPFYLAGDGSSSALELIRSERAYRSECDYLGRRFPNGDDGLLSALELDPGQVLAHGDVRVLRGDPPGPTSGGLSVDVLDDLGEELRTLGIDAMWSFPGLSAAAVDIRTPSLAGSGGALVSDVVPQANLSEFAYPAYGESRPCGKQIVDQMLLDR